MFDMPKDQEKAIQENLDLANSMLAGKMADLKAEYHGQLTPPPPVRMRICNPLQDDMVSFFRRLDAQEQAYRRIEIDSTEKPKEANHGT